jgi:hypothetical protein
MTNKWDALFPDASDRDPSERFSLVGMRQVSVDTPEQKELIRLNSLAGDEIARRVRSGLLPKPPPDGTLDAVRREIIAKEKAERERTDKKLKKRVAVA